MEDVRGRVRRQLLVVFAVATCTTCTRGPEPTVEPRIALGDLYAGDVSLAGCWSWSWIPGFDNTALCAERTDEGYELEFLRGTDFGPPWEHGTRAVASEGGWRLVSEHDSIDVQHLFPARFQGEDCLVPDSALQPFAAGALPWGNPDGREYAFRRAEDGHVRRVREELTAFWDSLGTTGGPR